LLDLTYNSNNNDCIWSLYLAGCTYVHNKDRFISGSKRRYDNKERQTDADATGRQQKEKE